MSCDLITKIDAFYAAYNALIARCCTGLTPISPSSCAGASILAAYTAARALLNTTPSTCKKLTSSPGAPDPGSPPACLTATWLAGCASWLTSITCEPEGACKYPWQWTTVTQTEPVVITANQKTIRITFADSRNCGGTCSITQTGNITACFNATITGILRIAATGFVETQNPNFEQLEVKVNNVAVLNAASTKNGGGCVTESASKEITVPITAGLEYALDVWSSTMDNLFHAGAYWEVVFTEEAV